MEVRKRSSSDSMQPINVEGRTSFSENDSSERCRLIIKKLKPYQQLFTNRDALTWSIYSLRFAVLCNAANSTILKPNYPIMALPGGHPDSFESTVPFDFNAATYFMSMSALSGVAVASTIIGKLSDEVGRKPCIFFSLIGAGIGSMLKYFLRRSFWAFCGASFFTGLCSASLPIAMAYATDVLPKKKEKDIEVGKLVGFNMLGQSGGGICAILLENNGLFTPLWIGVFLMTLSTLILLFFLIEPREYKEMIVAHSKKTDENIEIEDTDKNETEKPPSSITLDKKMPANKDDIVKGEGAHENETKKFPIPTTLDKKVLSNIILGSLADNIGSAGLSPLCLSPLAFNAYNTDFVELGLEPIMSQTEYKWITVMLALMVIPSTLVTPSLFGEIGTAGTCVLGNLVTGSVTICLLYIGLFAPATVGWYAGFITILYLCFPFTVLSQLTTGPMLAVISPPSMRGFVQGLNITVMNFGMALTPWILGMVADKAGTFVAIWICIGVSFCAALINAPLMFKKGLGIPPKPLPKETQPIEGEYQEYIEKANRGEWIPIEILSKIKLDRIIKGHQQLLLHTRKYEEEKQDLPKLRKRAISDYNFLREQRLGYIEKFNLEENQQSICDKINNSRKGDPEEIKTINQELGVWFTDYLVDNGYFPHASVTVYKQLLMSAFPPIDNNVEVTPDDFNEWILQTDKLLQRYIEVEERNLSQLHEILALAKQASYVNY